MPDATHETPELDDTGNVVDEIPVHITYRIIELFSEGLYASPNKAIEELVSNSFDALATHVHVIIDPDLNDESSSIAVIDNGTGMDADGLKEHWIIGSSAKREKPTKGRRPIGKFGIGKLATFVLANKLTHVTKTEGRYLAATMNYADVPSGDAGVFSSDDRQMVNLPLRELSEDEAETLLAPWLSGDGVGYSELTLFGPGSAESWTAAIMTDLKPIAARLRMGRLKWVLRTAMPLRDDFRLFVNGDVVRPAAIDKPRVGIWRLGGELVDAPKPASTEFVPTEDERQPADALDRFGLTHPELGRVIGYLEIFEDPLTDKKSDEIERSNGFFVYVRGRLVNLDDPGFGIDRNKLRHGTFSRFRTVVHIDRLDDELRSSRERFREGGLYQIAQNLLHGLFNFARNELKEFEDEQSPEARVRQRVDSSPASLTVRPVIDLAKAVFDGRAQPKRIVVPPIPDEASQAEYLEELRNSIESGESWVQVVEHRNLTTDTGVAVLELTRPSRVHTQTRRQQLSFVGGRKDS